MRNPRLFAPTRVYAMDQEVEQDAGKKIENDGVGIVRLIFWVPFMMNGGSRCLSSYITT